MYLCLCVCVLVLTTEQQVVDSTYPHGICNMYPFEHQIDLSQWTWEQFPSC